MSESPATEMPTARRSRTISSQQTSLRDLAYNAAPVSSVFRHESGWVEWDARDIGFKSIASGGHADRWPTLPVGVLLDAALTRSQVRRG